MKANSIFIDTWGWMTLGDRKEPRNKELGRFYRQLVAKRARIYTSDYVLSELATFLFRRETFSVAALFIENIMVTAKKDQIFIERITADRFEAAWKLRKGFQDKPGISFTDLTSMAIMAELGIQQVLTEDAHFTHVGMGFARVP